MPCTGNGHLQTTAMDPSADGLNRKFNIDTGNGHLQTTVWWKGISAARSWSLTLALAGAGQSNGQKSRQGKSQFFYILHP